MRAETRRNCFISTAAWWLRFVAVLPLVMEHMQGALAKTVYFNSYGQCNSREYYALVDEVFTARATGAQELHETLICDMTFKAPPDSGICLTFKEFEIQDSRVSLLIYQRQTASGVQWKKLTADSNVPEQMCTPERFVTLRLQKGRLNNNNGYSFEIQIERSSNLTGEDVILASSIGLFVGIIVGVVALITFIAVIVLCCCCRPCQSSGYNITCKGANTATDSSDLMQHRPAAPSAPPALELEDETSPLQQQQHHHQGPSAGPPPYPSVPTHQYPAECYPGTHHGWPIADQPPPYDPPPYEQHLNTGYPTKD